MNPYILFLHLIAHLSDYKISQAQPCLKEFSLANTTLTAFSSSYPREVLRLMSANNTVQNLDDLTGFSAELFAEFVQMSCVNVTLNHKDFRQISDYFQYREQVVLNQSMGNIAFPNLQLPTESVLEHFQISLPIVMYPALILHLEDNDGFDPRPNPKFLVYYLILLAVGAFFLVIIVKVENKIDSSICGGLGEALWNFLLIPFGLSDSTLTVTTSRKMYLFVWNVIWFLFIMVVSANYSSILTVSKLQDNVNTFQDVLDGNQKFFMHPFLEHSEQSLVKELTKKYAKLKGNNKSYSLQGLGTEGYTDMTSKLLQDRHLYLTLVNFLAGNEKKLMEKLGRAKIVIKTDWSCYFLGHYFFKTSDFQLLKSFNKFVQRKKSDGTLEKLTKKWFSIHAFTNSKGNSQDAITEDMTLNNLVLISLFGSIFTLIALICHSLLKRTAVKPNGT